MTYETRFIVYAVSAVVTMLVYFLTATKGSHEDNIQLTMWSFFAGIWWPITWAIIAAIAGYSLLHMIRERIHKEPTKLRPTPAVKEPRAGVLWENKDS